jgi:branched-chain amino acid transport system permease protein
MVAAFKERRDWIVAALNDIPGVNCAMPIDLLATLTALLTFFGIYGLMALSLNLEYGVAGVPNFGQALFVSIGAYTAGWAYTRLLPWLVSQPAIDPCGPEMARALELRGAIMNSLPDIGLFNFAITLVVAAAIGGFIGYLVSFAARRVKEEWYLGLVLLVASEAFRIVVRGYGPLICGFNGLAGIAQPFGWIEDVRLSSALFALFVLIVLALAYFYCERLTCSPFSRALKAMRENDRVALSLGKPVPRLRAQIMFIGSAIAAIAGVLFAVNLGFVNTNDYAVGLTLDIWVMVVLGGIGNNRGALLGALLVTVLNRLTAIVAIALNAGGSEFEFNYVRYILFAIILLLVLRYRRQGLLPERVQTTQAHEVLQ